MSLCSKFQCFTKPETEISPQVLLEATGKVECVITEGGRELTEWLGVFHAKYDYTSEIGWSLLQQTK